MKKEVALVLSSGGARGFAHIGAIKILEDQGYNITSVAGTSMGALVGGIFAAGRLKEFEEWVCSLDRMEVLRLTDLTISNKGLVKGIKIIERIKEIVPDSRIEDLPIPYCAVATDILKGKEKVFNTGNLYDAIRASISIPTVFQPFRIGEDYYVDGGVVNPVPINRVNRNGRDILAVVAVNSNIPHEVKTPRQNEPEDNSYLRKIRNLQAKLSIDIPKSKNDNIGLFNLTNRSISIMLNQIASLTLANHKIDIMIQVSKEAFGTYDFYKAGEIIKEGEMAALKALGARKH
ncbi:MAG: patatin-like phospholipase family protein [Bacteroidales bacterium]|jgi:NTE family protein|nr:patatin-like phospholipase family protein [Bacteroidales bacterium]